MANGVRAHLVATMRAMGAAGAASLMIASPAHGQEGGPPQQPPNTEEPVVVTGERPEQELSSPLHTQPLMETPQTVTVLEEEMLREQSVVTLRDAMRNITGVSIQAGEGNPPSGDAMKIRGFSARDDILLDGMPDVGNYLRDPFYAQSIEITQGPASAYAGRGNAGGTINLVTRQPVMDYIRLAEMSVGTDNYYRGTVDANYVLDDKLGIALRINGMVHSADEPGRDHAHNDRWGLNTSLSVGLDMDTRATFSFLHIAQNELPDMGLPNARDFSLAGSGLEGRVAPVDPSNFYGYSTDYRDIVADVLTVRFEHDFSENASIFTQFRYGRTLNDSVISSPRYVGSNSNGPPADPPAATLDQTTLANGFRKPRDETDTLLINQTNLTTRFDTGPILHTLVTGFEVSLEEAENLRRIDARGPASNLFNPTFQAAAPIPYNGTRAILENETVAFYAFDNIELSPQWELNVGVRHDSVRTHVLGLDSSGLFPAYETDLSRTDRQWSGSVSAVYHPIEGASLYVGYGTSFEPSGRFDIVQLAGANNNPPVTPANFNVDPERSRSLELGIKWPIGQLEFTAALFRTEKINARTPSTNPNDPPVVLEGEQQVEGFVIGFNGEIVDRWAIFANYTYLEGAVTRSNNPFEIGQRLDNLPRHSFSLWTTYQVTPELRIGGGGQYVSERISNIRPSATADFAIVAPAYTIFDAVATYRAAEEVELRLNLTNITDEVYYQSFQQSHSIPGARRAAILTVALGF